MINLAGPVLGEDKQGELAMQKNGGKIDVNEVGYSSSTISNST